MTEVDRMEEEYVNGDKGLSPLLSHVLALAILFAAFGLVTANMYNYYESVAGEAQESGTRILANGIADGVVDLEDLYRDSDVEPSGVDNITLGTLVMDVPDRLSGRNYRIELKPRGDFWITNNITVGGNDTEPLEETRPYSRVIVETVGPQPISFTRDMNNVHVKTEGSVRGVDRIQLEYVRDKSDGKVTDTVVLSEA